MIANQNSSQNNENTDDNNISKCSFGSFKGYAYAVIGAANFCIGNIIVKLDDGLNATDHLTIFYGIQLFAMIGYALYVKEPLLGPIGSGNLLIFRGIFHLISILATYYALVAIPASDVTAIGHCSIIFVAILSRFFLKELLGIPHLFAIVLTFFGVALIAKPTFIFGSISMANNENFNQTLNMTEINDKTGLSNILSTIIGVSLSLLAAASRGIIRFLTKKSTNIKIHWAITNLFTSYIGLPISLVVSIVLYSTGISSLELFQKGASEISYQIGLSVLAGVFRLVGFVYYILALNYEDATKLAIATSLDLVIAFILQYIIIGEQIGVLSVIGSLLIFIGCSIVLVYKLLANNNLKAKEVK